MLLPDLTLAPRPDWQTVVINTHLARVFAAHEALCRQSPGLGVAYVVAAGDARLAARFPVRLQRPPLGPAMLASPLVSS